MESGYLMLKYRNLKWLIFGNTKMNVKSKEINNFIEKAK